MSFIIAILATSQSLFHFQNIIFFVLPSVLRRMRI